MSLNTENTDERKMKVKGQDKGLYICFFFVFFFLMGSGRKRGVDALVP